MEYSAQDKLLFKIKRPKILEYKQKAKEEGEEDNIDEMNIEL